MDSKNRLPNLHDFGFKMWIFFHKAPMIFLMIQANFRDAAPGGEFPPLGAESGPSLGGDVLR